MLSSGNVTPCAAVMELRACVFPVSFSLSTSAFMFPIAVLLFRAERSSTQHPGCPLHAACAPCHPLLLMSLPSLQRQIKATFLSPDPFASDFFHILLKLKPVEATSSKATQITGDNNSGDGIEAAKLQKLSGMVSPSVSGLL